MIHPEPIARPKRITRPLDSTRLIPLTTGRVGVVFARGPDGKRPPSRAAETVDEAQKLVAAHREVSTTGVRANPKGSGR